MNAIFRRQIAIPQDHGAWVFIFSPLAIGMFAGRTLQPGTPALLVGVLAGFLLRQPVTMIVKVLSGRRPRRDLPASFFWAGLYGLAGAAALAVLIVQGQGYVGYLLLPALPVLAWQLWLVSRRAERRQAPVELAGACVLALAAPAAEWVGIGRYDPAGWWLWLLAWLQSAASILYAYLRLEQRLLPEAPGRPEQWRMARRALAATSFNVAFTLLLAAGGLLPRLIFVPYTLQWLESLWGASHPAVRVKPVWIGVRQLVVSLVWTALFIAVWR